MNVCLLNDSFPPSIDGVANVMKNYAEDLTENGNKVLVVTPDYPGVIDNYPYDVFRYSSIDTEKSVGYRTGNPFSIKAVEAVKQFRPDIYHVHCPMTSCILSKTMRDETPAPLVFTYHTKFDIDIQRAIKNHLLQEISIRAIVNNISDCDEIWVVSEGAGKNLRSLGFKGDYRVMRNGVGFERGLPDQEACAAIRAYHECDDDTPMFLFVGRMMWYKGLKTVIDSLQGLKEAGVKFKMVFVGGGLEEKEIRQYTMDHNMYGVCDFTGPIRDREKLRQYYGAADLFMFLSDFDTNGIVVSEAASCGCASLLLEGSAAAEEVTDGRNAFLVGRNPVAVAAKLALLAQDRNHLREVGVNAMNELYFSWKDSVACAENRYNEILEEYRSGKLKLKKRPIEGVIDKAMEYGETISNLRNVFEREKWI